MSKATAARSQLSEAEAEAAWAEGAAMTLKETVAYAVGEADAFSAA